MNQLNDSLDDIFGAPSGDEGGLLDRAERRNWRRDHGLPDD